MTRTERNHRVKPTMDPYAPLPVHLFSMGPKQRRLTNFYHPVPARNVASLLNGPGAPRRPRHVISRVHNIQNLNELNRSNQRGVSRSNRPGTRIGHNVEQEGLRPPVRRVPHGRDPNMWGGSRRMTRKKRV